MIIGIDGSTKATGYAFGGDQDALPRGGVWTTPGCDEMGGKFDITLGNLGRSIMEVSKLLRPRAIYIEGPMDEIDREHSRATWAALMQLTGGMRTAAALVQCRVELVSVYNVRKFFIGTGRLPGEIAKKKVQERCTELGWEFKDHNHADALATWAFGMSREYPGWAPNQRLLFGRDAA